METREKQNAADHPHPQPGGRVSQRAQRQAALRPEEEGATVRHLHENFGGVIEVTASAHCTHFHDPERESKHQTK